MNLACMHNCAKYVKKCATTTTTALTTRLRAQRDLRATLHVRSVFTNSSSEDTGTTNLVMF